MYNKAQNIHNLFLKNNNIHFSAVVLRNLNSPNFSFGVFLFLIVVGVVDCILFLLCRDHMYSPEPPTDGVFRQPKR